MVYLLGYNATYVAEIATYLRGNLLLALFYEPEDYIPFLGVHLFAHTVLRSISL
jgi:hypothetical protein